MTAYLPPPALLSTSLIQYEFGKGNSVGSPEEATNLYLGRQSAARSGLIDSRIAPFPAFQSEASTPQIDFPGIVTFGQIGSVQTSFGQFQGHLVRHPDDLVTTGPVNASYNYVIAHSPFVAAELGGLFAVAREERFEDGMSSRFGDAVEEIFKVNGDASLADFISLVHNPLTSPIVAAESLRSLARVCMRAKSASRRMAIESGLTHNSPLVRDAATLALVALGDKGALPSMKSAWRHEQLASLKSDMEQAINELVNE